MYVNGFGVRRDYEQAISWYEKAAAQGNTRAQSNMAMMYAQGLGVTQDLKKAAYWFKLAAQGGYELAQFQMGQLYSTGSGVDQDYTKAVFGTVKRQNSMMVKHKIVSAVCMLKVKV